VGIPDSRCSSFLVNAFLFVKAGFARMPEEELKRWKLLRHGLKNFIFNNSE